MVLWHRRKRDPERAAEELEDASAIAAMLGRAPIPAVPATAFRVLATIVPVQKSSWWKTTSGLVLGVASVAMLRCGTLYLGEALGLVGGLLAGVAAASLARRLYSKTTSTSAS